MDDQQADAKAIVNHYQQSLHGAEPDTSEQGINFLLAAGAKGEVLRALEQRLEVSPQDPYARAVSIEVGCWDPSTRQQAQADASDWLELHPVHHLTEYVQVRKDWLDGESAHLTSVANKQRLAEQFPLLAFGVALLLCAVGLRSLFRRL